MCAGGWRPAREPSAPRASLGASARSPAWPLCVLVGGALPAYVARGAAAVAGAVGPGLPRDRHTLCYRSEWLISKPALVLRILRRPPQQWRMVADRWLGASAEARPGPAAVHLPPAWPCRRLPAPWPCPPSSPAPVTPAACAVLWFPSNVARNSPACISRVDVRSLELQRFEALLKVQAIELRATFAGV